MKLVIVLTLLYLSINSPITLAGEQVIIDHYHDPSQKTQAYAAKLFWNKRDKIWQKKIVIYGNAPDPKKSHAVWRYVKKLKIPHHAGSRDLYYKRFYLTGNCINKTPLARGKLWSINFDHNTLGTYQAAQFREDWHCPEWKMGLNLVSVVTGEHAYSGKALQLHFSKGVSGCTHPKRCINWKPLLDREFTTLYYGYRFKFAPNFPFAQGGKLLGVGGGIANSNGKVPTGRDGWSVRMMWQHDGTLTQYVYHPDQPKQFGELMPLTMQPLTLNQWHTLQTKVTLNNAGKKNGSITTWLNGKIVLNRQHLRFRDGNDLKINRLLFASFYGGQGARWAPKWNSSLFIDDIRIAPYAVF